MQISIEMNGQTLVYNCKEIKLDYGLFKPKRKSEQCLKIYQEERILIYRMSDLDYFKVV